MVWSILAAALLGILLGIPARRSRLGKQAMATIGSFQFSLATLMVAVTVAVAVYVLVRFERRLVFAL